MLLWCEHFRLVRVLDTALDAAEHVRLEEEEAPAILASVRP